MVNKYDLARTFSRLLADEMGEDNLWEAVERNDRDAERSLCCHTHDFCDANQVMLDALAEHGILCDESPDAERCLPADEYMVLAEEAWDIAKGAEFDSESIQQLQALLEQ